MNNIKVETTVVTTLLFSVTILLLVGVLFEIIDEFTKNFILSKVQKFKKLGFTKL